MNLTFFIVLGLAFLCFIIPAIRYVFIARKGVFEQRGWRCSVFLPAAGVLLPVMLAAWFLFFDERDFITSFTLPQLLMPFAGALLILFVGNKTTDEKAVCAAVFAAAMLSVVVLPEESLFFISFMPAWAARLSIAACWILFTLFWRFVNNGDGSLAVFSAAASLGVGILGTVNALPVFIGAAGWFFTAVFLVLTTFSWYPSRVKISSVDAAAFGFLLFSLLLSASAEGAVSCSLIFIMFPLVDFCWALILRLTVLSCYADLIDNSGFRQAVNNGISPDQAASLIIRSQMLTLLLGCFQAYSPAPGSLLLIALLLSVWLNYRLRFVSAPQQTIRDINAQVLEELQDRVNEFKSYLKEKER